MKKWQEIIERRNERNLIDLIKVTLRKNKLELAFKRNRKGGSLDFLKVSSLDTTPLHEAVEKSWERGVELLIPVCDVNKPMGASQLTPLHVAVFKGHPSIVEKLLKAGANPLATTSSGDTGSKSAFYLRQWDVLREFIKKDPLFMIQTMQGMKGNPWFFELMRIAVINDKEVHRINALLKTWEDAMGKETWKTVNQEQENAWHTLAQISWFGSKNKETFDFWKMKLIHMGVDPDGKNKEGVTPFMMAVASPVMNQDFLKDWVELSSVDLTDHAGKTAWDYAHEQNDDFKSHLHFLLSKKQSMKEYKMLINPKNQQSDENKKPKRL